MRDILVVAPYNMQVRCLREGVPPGVEVGTVDKFQGREAPVVFFSMASSSGEDVPRGLEFLFSRNRFNVAISRAKALAVVVCSPQLLNVPCRKVSQMALVNGLCRFVEAAGAARLPTAWRHRSMPMSDDDQATLDELFEDGRAIDEALKEAARDARRLHKALGNPMT